MVMAIFMLVFIVFAFGFLYFWGLNPGDVTVVLASDQSLTFPIPIMLIGAVLVGLLVGHGFHLFSMVVHWFTHVRTNRTEKKSKEVVSVYREGVARLLSGDLKKARTLLRKALDRDPGRVEVYLALASLNEQEGDSQEAVTLLHKAKEIEPSSLEVLFKLATTYEAMDKGGEAAKIYEEILAIESSNRKALRNMRDLKMGQGHWQEALDLQKRVLKAIQGSPRQQEEKRKQLYLRYEVSRQTLAEGDAEKALESLEKIVKEDAEFVPARVSLGDAYRGLSRSEDAANAWKEGYRAMGRGIFLARLEDLYMSEEDPSSLLSFYRSQVVERDSDLMLRLFFGKLCLRLEMVDEAMDQLQVVEGSGVEVPQLHQLLAEGYRRRKNHDQAISEYQQALGGEARMRLPFDCQDCGERIPEWNSRCASCGSWGSYSLAGSEEIRGGRPIEMRPIHHGERG